MIYVVLGMHKSGTTLVARLLDESGIHMGEFDARLGYGEGNKFERFEAQAANRQLLDGLLLPPVDHLIRRRFRPKFDAAGYPANQDSQAYVRRRALERRLETKAAARVVAPVIADCEARHDDWGWKDPRSCLTYPAWRASLPEHRLIVVYRGLGQVLQRSRGNARHPLRAARVLYNWTLYNYSLLRHLEASDQRCLVLRYEELMSGDEGLERLSDFIGRPLKDARDENLYRARVDEGPPAWTNTLAALLTRLPMTRALLPMSPRELEARLGGWAR